MIGVHTAAYAVALRRELCERARLYAERHRIPHALSYGAQPAVVFSRHDENEPSATGTLHGNFLPATYKAILRNDNWRGRLEKVHTQAKSSLPASEHGGWRELDTCASSDALLMNVFCYPGALRDGRVQDLLGVERAARPEFGVRARVPLANGHFDRTEVDLRLGSLLAEAKLTESDFQTAAIDVVAGYRDFDDVFQRSELARSARRYLNYQLIRNVLAAHATGASFCVLADARRPDLVESWYGTMRAVKPVELRLRCKVLTWQELATALPARLQEFLAEKYGIE